VYEFQLQNIESGALQLDGKFLTFTKKPDFRGNVKTFRNWSDGKSNFGANSGRLAVQF